MANIARDTIWPTDPEILVRVVVLHVGQGNAVLVLAADGDTYKTMLVDINLDPGAGGIDVPVLVKDLLDGEDLPVFTNTHPHNDHLCGVLELDEAVTINEVWHSGHVPGEDDCAAYDNLQTVIANVKDNGGDEVELDGSRTPYAFGEAECYILAPAEHVKDSIDDETEAGRRERIHEHCAVLRVGSGSTWIMIPGDADREAWENHITEYHAERVPSQVLIAPHHGSRSFFYKAEDKKYEDPYLDALDTIDPTWVIISAPTQDESRHGHPHDEALEHYVDKVGEDNVLHTGADRHSFICDIFRDGTCTVTSDDGALTDAYPYDPDGDDDDGDDGGEKASGGPSVFTPPPADVRKSHGFAC